MYELAVPLADHQHTTFFMKDLYDAGLVAVKNVPPAAAQDSLSIVEGYTILDEAVDAEGKPNRDYHLWTGLAMVLITAGDIAHAAVKVRISRDPADPAVIRQWSFYYEMNDLEYLFLTIYPTDQTAEQSTPTFACKAMGSIDKKSYMVKIGAYPLQVNPAMAGRSTSALGFVAAQYLTIAGLHLDASWHPDDTSKHHARYHLTDGVDHYIIDYAAPVLLKALAFIDHVSGRTEADGAIILDEDTPILNDYTLPQETLEVVSEPAASPDAAQASLPTHDNPML